MKFSIYAKETRKVQRNVHSKWKIWITIPEASYFNTCRDISENTIVMGRRCTRERSLLAIEHISELTSKIHIGNIT